MSADRTAPALRLVSPDCPPLDPPPPPGAREGFIVGFITGLSVIGLAAAGTLATLWLLLS